MAIQSGTHLGPYEILSAIGAGAREAINPILVNSQRGESHDQTRRG